MRDRGSFFDLTRDFGFAQRPGRIELFTFELELDKAWLALDPVRPLRRENLPPGEGLIVSLELERVGSGTMTGVDRAVPTGQIWALAVVLLSLLGLKLVGLWRAETRLGRHRRPEVPAPITREWLDEHLFSLRPEEAGALWDRKVGAAEVAAVIARLVSAGKLSSRVGDDGRWFRKPTLALDLIVDREDLDGYERELIDKLFFGGRTTTDTRALRQHYSSKGFEPASAIRPAIETRLKRLPGAGERPDPPSWKPSALLLLAFVAAVVLEAVTRGIGALGPLIAALAVVGVVPVLWAYVAALLYRDGLGRPPVAWLWFLVPLALLVAGCLFAAWSGAGGRELLVDLRPGLFGVLALTLYPLLVGNSVLNTAHTREERETVARRQRLAAVRRHFAAELDRPTPHLQDGWLPYILAFGLSDQADHWALTHGAEARAASYTGATSWSSSSSTASGWSGGGGAFGGTLSAWTAAAIGLASGVSAPSSGSSGGGGGSVGGGGGGGW